jgi:hypothetical protein
LVSPAHGPPKKKKTTKAITDLDFAFFSLMFSLQQQCLLALPFSVERHCDAPRNGSKFGIPYIKVCGGRVCHSLDCIIWHNLLLMIIHL